MMRCHCAKGHCEKPSYAECRYAKVCHAGYYCAEWRYAECHHHESRGASWSDEPDDVVEFDL